MALEQLRLANDRRLVTTTAALFVAQALWYWPSDFVIAAGDPPRLYARLAVRGVLIAAMAGGIGMMGRVQDRDGYSRLAGALGLALAMAIVALNALRPEGSTLPLRTPLFAIAAMYGLLPNTPIRQIGPPLLLSAGMVVLRLTWLTSNVATDPTGDVMIVMVFNIGGFMVARQRRVLEREVGMAWQHERDVRVAAERMASELRTLRGIIPICSFCQKVRTEVGDWQQIGRYVQQHTEAEFSHGICPDCRDLHYPDLPAGPRS